MGHTARRDYTLAFKREVVEEALAPGASVAAISRRRDINSNLIFTWRKQYREGALGPSALNEVNPALPPPAFVPVGIVDDTGQARPIAPAAGEQRFLPQRAAVKPVPVSRAIELELRNGIKLRFDAGLTTETLRRVVNAVKSCT